jgi:hypothetical protein
MKPTSNSGAAALVLGAALSVVPMQAMAAGYSAPPVFHAPVFRAPPPVYVAPRVMTTPGVAIKPVVTVKPSVTPPGSTAKPGHKLATARTPVPRRQVATPVFIPTTSAAAKCSPKQIEVLARCKDAGKK